MKREAHAIPLGLAWEYVTLNIMSWIKSNFLWMMYRSGWGSNTEQEFKNARI
ncbi:MAG: DUF4291 domain-containing protein [Okeania sp. SIO2C9]|uniref:DUF4291 family protein n=1 Tax=Okeania sp. SIO2C9 TaxID=2607791 RepID=UPI0013C26B76|nr:DUF4291 family protein [Okeania sp. SIO2C9]NEQ76446.1 DUF4291 domain-containing protein [Okeania sp. SIO2C9]